MEHHNGTPCWIALHTPAPEVQQRFYTAVLGWQWVEHGPGAGSSCLASLDGAWVAGLHSGSLVADHGRLGWVVYFQTPDVDGRAAAVAEAGGRVLLPPRDAAETGRAAMVADPTGAVFGLWQSTQRGFQTLGVPGAPCWFEVRVPNRGAAISFYAAQFGGTPQAMAGMAPPYFTMHVGGRPRYGILETPEEGADAFPHWMTYFLVRNADAAADRVTTAKGTV